MTSTSTSRAPFNRLLLTGAAGAIVGGWIGELIFNRGTGGFFSLWSWVLAIGGSLLVLWVYGKVTAKK